MLNKGIEPVTSVTLYYRLDPKNIMLLKSLLEGYEGLVVLRTEDPKEGIIQLLVSPDFVEDIQAAMADLAQKIWMEPVSE